jgi:MFS family permease
MGLRKNSLDLRPTYFFCYTASEVLFPFLNLHFVRLGLTGLQMGTLAALAVLVGAGGSIGWSFLLDRFRKPRALLGTAVGGGMICAFLVSRAQDFPSLLAWSGLWSLMGSPILPILDSLAVRASPEQGGYGHIRVWGTAGWAVATLTMGYLLDRVEILWIFYGYMAG